MDTTLSTFGDYVTVLKRRAKLVTAIFVALMALTALVAYLWPASYRSTATILIESQDIPQDLVRTTVNTFASEQIQIITQRAMTTSNLSDIVDKFDLYSEMRARSPRTEIIQKVRDNIELDVLSEEVVDPRNGRAQMLTIAFTLSFDHPDPNTAQDVANELVSLYLEENSSQRRDAARSTKDFLEAEAEKLRVTIDKLEADLAEFKRDNADRLPEIVELNRRLLDRTERELEGIAGSLQYIEDRRLILNSELSQLTPTVGLITPSGQTILSNEDQVAAARTQLDQLESVYGPDHPDVVRTRRQLESLSGEADSGQRLIDIDERLAELRGQLNAASERYSDEHPDVRRYTRQIEALEAERAALVDGVGSGSVTTRESVRTGVNVRATTDPDGTVVGTLARGARAELIGEQDDWFQIRLADGTEGFVARSVTRRAGAGRAMRGSEPSNPTNPAYLQVKTQLDTLAAQEVALLERRDRLTRQLAEFEIRLAETPLVEQQGSALFRDLGSARNEYQKTLAKLKDAERAEVLEQELRGERFRLIEPAAVPDTPYSPNRVAILLLGFVLSVAGAFGAMAIAESIDQSIRGAASITALTGRAPLAQIPVIEFSLSDDEAGARLRRRAGVAVAAGLVAVTVLLSALHIFYKPLDVLWFVAMRKIGG